MRHAVLFFALFAFGCASSNEVVVDGEPGGDATGAGGAKSDSGAGGAKPDAAKGGGGAAGRTGGGPGAGGSPGVGGSAGAPNCSEPLTPPAYTYPGAAGTAPAASWANITNNLAGMGSECGNAAAIFASPWEDMLVTGVARNGLYSSKDGGASWTLLSSAPLGRMTVVLFDPTNASTFWVSLIYGWESPWSQGVFVTKDGGASMTGFTNMGTQMQSHNDSVSVDFNDPARMTILSGGHEQRPSGGQGVFLSRDGGNFFDDIATTFPSDLGFCTTTLVLNSCNLLVGCNAGYAGGSGAIMRSTDAGATWTNVSTKGVDGQPVWAKDDAIYWAAQGGGLQKSTDHGATFTQISTGGFPPIELPDGRIATTSGSNIVVSADGGATWTTAAAGMPFGPNGLSYSAYRKAFYISHFTCDNPVPADAYARFGWDYTTN